jgi:hypothetical protein
MKNLKRIDLPKIPLEMRETMKTAVVSFIRSLTKPQRIIFFGSINSEHFDACSDIDVVTIYETPQAADQARRVLYTAHRPELGHSIEFLCVDAAAFAKKSEIGGVYAIAKEEGHFF